MSTRILFVDDEPLILQGLERSLRPLRKEWQAAYAAGGEEALALLENGPFDVIVTDMRMPGMDGATLLDHVMRRYPDIVRMVLSGQSDLESVIKSAGVTHQYLSKPCSIESLKDAVNRAVSLRHLLGNASLKQVVSRMRSIPSVPPLYVELTNCLKSKDGSLEKARAIIQQDMGMSAKVLQLANSGLFGAAGRISSASEAVTYLGLDTIRTLLLTLHAFSEFQPGGAANFSMASLWRHSVTAGALAERIMQSLPAAGAEGTIDMRIIGLLHDTGRLVLAANLPESFEQILRLAAEKRILYWEAEREVFGTTHAEVGAYLFGLWGLPEAIVEAVAYHHTPAQCPRPGSPMLTALHVADVLVSEMDESEAAWHTPEPDLEYLAGLGAADRLPEWRELASRMAAEEAPHG
ncbi:MAG TPA: response regulator [Bryobacteraceae bacterium]|nr:response regulator [Bryobacteraceae bacterium]